MSAIKKGQSENKDQLLDIKSVYILLEIEFRSTTQIAKKIKMNSLTEMVADGSCGRRIGN